DDGVPQTEIHDGRTPFPKKAKFASIIAGSDDVEINRADYTSLGHPRRILWNISCYISVIET
ncbi:hypothetical protein, partial [Methanocalculus sp.]|uniref:hypothetical protein n=1 Tax=Methanocalculus sp. TaxID=2004547 RepID=UPI00262EFDCF